MDEDRDPLNDVQAIAEDLQKRDYPDRAAGQAIEILLLAVRGLQATVRRQAQRLERLEKS
ncbi:MAG: hypothetical protein GY719_26155 [bacterium]|nr:hypothetical protein [bacterium]